MFSRVIGSHRLDQPDGPNGDQILDAHSSVFNPSGDIHYQPQIVLNERSPGILPVCSFSLQPSKIRSLFLSA